ncbi:hypothetical protein [Haloimpatiens massiliensis]|uniref:hypothetical protein n=1 Tax=Haloimpatiens massiliensis TaxID=1658110 RepID=UPI000C840D0F|nr:hypothetical protein [Haloimpatiens massiliensis]
MRLKKINILSIVLSAVMLLGFMPTTVFAATENGYTLATATSRDYNGTAVVDVTDMVFADVFDSDNVSADAVGTLSSPNAGTYDRINLSNIQPKGADIGWYEFPSSMDNIPTSITISKVDPVIDLTVQPSKNTVGGEGIVVTATITNNFNNNEGLPTAKQFNMSVQNATLKSGTTTVKNGNSYTATYITDSNKVGQNITVTANVSDTATNYNSLVTPVTKTLPIVQNAHELWVNGIDISVAENNTVACGKGTATYDKATSTLTLNNATIDTAHNGAGIIKPSAPASNSKLNIALIGDNVITTSSISQINVGISTMGQLNISGNGKLSVTTATDSQSYTTYGIYAYSGLTVIGAELKLTDTSTLTDYKNSAIDVNEFSSSLKIENAIIKIANYDMGINVPSGDIQIIGSTIIGDGTYFNRGVAGGNEIDNFIIKDSVVDFNVSGENSLGLLNGYEIQIDNSNVTLTSETSNAIYTDGGISITNGSNVDVTGYLPALFSVSDTTIKDSYVKATSTNDSGIYSKANIIINGASNIIAKGYYAAINANGDITVNDGKVNATSTNDMGIWARGSIAFNGGDVYAKGAEGYAALGVRYNKQPGDTVPITKVTVNDNYDESTGGKISVSDWDNNDRSWTSFIAKDDENKLSIDRSNALNEITIKIKTADYSKVDEAIEKANALNKDNYKDFSTVKVAINAVVRNKNITEQKTVDGYATAIENAIKALVYKNADYKKVDEAITKIPSDLSQYTDETVKALNDAKNAVIRDKNITAQTSVDTYAIAIENAITGLKLKGQDNQSNKDNSTVAPNKADNKIQQRENLPSTGDKTNLRLLAFMLIISGGMIVFITHKKKHIHNPTK